MVVVCVYSRFSSTPWIIDRYAASAISRCTCFFNGAWAASLQEASFCASLYCWSLTHAARAGADCLNRSSTRLSFVQVINVSCIASSLRWFTARYQRQSFKRFAQALVISGFSTKAALRREPSAVSCCRQLCKTSRWLTDSWPSEQLPRSTF